VPPKDAPAPTDAERFREVAEIAKALGMRVGGFVVGDIRVQLATPWPESQALANVTAGPDAHAEDQTAYVMDVTKAADDKELKELRRRSKITFGHVKPDKELLEMRSVL